MDDAKREQLRTKYFQESFGQDHIKENLKFGQFSMVASLSVGETNMFQKTKKRVNEDNEVITELANFKTAPPKKGKIDKSLFSVAPYAFQNGEHYTDKRMMMRDSKPLTKPVEHDRVFKPCKDASEKVVAAYGHMQEIKHVRKNFKNEEGEIATAPRNVVTAPLLSGNCCMKGATFGGMANHKAEDFFAAKKMAKAQLLDHQSKVEKIGEGKNFRSRVSQKTYFNDLPEWKKLSEMPNKIEKRPQTVDIHDGKPFRPSHPAKVGIVKKSIGTFPEYKPNPVKALTRIKPVEGEEAPPPFKKTHNAKSRPSPSVQTNVRNLKNAFPSVFKR